jgi:hypothetical protein
VWSKPSKVNSNDGSIRTTHYADYAQRFKTLCLTVHRRNRPSQPVHCFYTLGMAVTVQGSKHVLLGDKDLSYGPGQSLLTTVDLPVSYHITRATATEPYLGIMLKFDRNLITQVASKIEAKRPGKNEALEPIWIQRLDAPVLDAFNRLISLLDEPVVIPPLAALIQQEIIIRLLTGTHAAYLWNLVNAAVQRNRSPVRFRGSGRTSPKRCAWESSQNMPT